MKSGDIRSFFKAPGSGAPKPSGSNSQKPPQGSQDSGKTSQKKETPSKTHEDKKRKADVYDQGSPLQHVQKKKLKKLADFDDDFGEDEQLRIAIELSKKETRMSPRSPEYKALDKPSYTSDNIDAFKFDRKKKDVGGKPRDQPAPSKATKPPTSGLQRSSTAILSAESGGSNEAPKKRGKKMEIENFDDGNSSHTDVLSESDEDLKKKKSPAPKKSVEPPKSDGGAKSLKDLKNKYNKPGPAKTYTSKFDFLDDDDLEEEKKPAEKGKKKASATKGKVVTDTIQGPFSGQTVVITGKLDTIDRDSLTDILKALGAKVTGSVSSKTTILIVGSILEDGRPVNESRKYKTAEEKGTKIYTESEFDDYLQKKTGKSLTDGVDAFMGGVSAAPAANTSAGKGAPQASGKGQQAVATIPKKKKPGQVSTDLWTTEYAPHDVNDVIGNQSFIKQIMDWLKDWEDVVIHGNKKDVKFMPGKSRDNWGTSNVNAKACLVSGPPGIGKTTSVRLIAKKLGYDVIEQNASDVRNKKSVEGLLNHLVSNTLVSYSAQGRKREKFIILMDEVDGMSAGDRGGNQALINAIKNTKVPIICICNDRMHTKVRSLANHCYDIRFHKPAKQMIAKRMAEIAQSEGLKVDMNSMEYLCESFGNDIRQILNLLQMYARKSNTLTYADAKGQLGKTRKDDTVMLNNFDAARKLMTERNMGLRDKVDLFFIDYDLIPLLVQENYLSSAGPSSYADLEKFAKAADMLATGDIINRRIRGSGDWGLMPNFAFMSAIYPSETVNTMVPFPKFPEWLGKNSSQRKKQREIKELRSMMSGTITGSRLAVLFDYTPAMAHLLHYNLKDETADDIETVVEILDHYKLELDMAKEHIPDLQLITASVKDPFSGVSPQTKAALTRTFNARHKSSVKAAKKKRVVGGGGEEGAGTGHKFNPEAEEEEEEEQELGDDLEGEENEEEDESLEVTGKTKGKAAKGGAKSKGSTTQKGGKGGTSEKKRTTKK